MAVLVNLAATMICSVVLKPSLKEVSDSFLTPFNPDATALALYWLVTFILLISYCLLLIMANGTETKVGNYIYLTRKLLFNSFPHKKTVVHGVGLRLVFVQYFMTLNVVAFTLKWFIASLVFTSFSLLLLVWIHLSLYLYPPNRSRLLDFILIHAPIRLLIVVTFLQHLPQTLFIVLGWTPHMPEDIQEHAWHAVTFIVSFNVLGLIEVALREDLVWAFAGMWIMIGQLIKRPKAAPVFVRDRQILFFTSERWCLLGQPYPRLRTWFSRSSIQCYTYSCSSGAACMTG